MPKSKHRKDHNERVAARRQEQAQREEDGGELPVPSRADLEAYVAAIPADERAENLATAEEMLERVFEADDAEEQLELITEAISIAPLCARGYLMLAGVLEESLDDALPLFRTAFDAAELAAGGFAVPGSLTAEHDDYLWAATAYAEALWGNRDTEAAVELLWRVLRQAGSNDVGVQYVLAPWLGELGRVEELEALVARYPDDDGVDWSFNRALLAFLKEGDSEASRTQLAAAADAYPAAVDALLDEIEVWEAYQAGEPPEDDPLEAADDDDEAMATKHFAMHAATAWATIPGALDWLFETLGIEEVEVEDEAE
jgi:hypothetical protein